MAPLVQETRRNSKIAVKFHGISFKIFSNFLGDEYQTLGIPKYIASGSHYFRDNRYRFLVLPRFKYDLHSIIKNSQLSQKHLLIIAIKTIDVLMHLHNKNYVHSDIKAENLMIGCYKDRSISGTPENHNFDVDEDDEKVLSERQATSSKKIRNKIRVHSTPYSGSNPVRSCRMAAKEKTTKTTFYEEMLKSHYLRNVPSIDYSAFLNGDSNDTHHVKNVPQYDDDLTDTDSDNDSDFELSLKRRNGQKRGRKSQGKKSPMKRKQRQQKPMTEPPQVVPVPETEDEEDHVYLIDYGLASKYIDLNGEHRPFCMDQRRAHDGTLEFTSRDAHFGAHSRRSDLECFGFNLIYWSQGFLPWKDEKMQQKPPELIHRLKEIFMADVKENIKLFYGKDVPKYLSDYMYYVGGLAYDEEPDYGYLKSLFQQELVRLGYRKDQMKLKLSEIKANCKPKSEISEMDLMTATVSDLKTVQKMGFLNGQENGETGVSVMSQVNHSFHLHSSSKLSPKYLRSKADKSGKGGKRQSKRDKVETERLKRRAGEYLESFLPYHIFNYYFYQFQDENCPSSSWSATIPIRSPENEPRKNTSVSMTN